MSPKATMASPSHVAFAAFCLIVIRASSPSAQVPPESNLYVLVDAGPAPAQVVCPCITTPFTLPAYRPAPGYGNGPAIPDSTAPLSADDRQRYAERFAEERALLPREAQDGLSGNPNASMSVAMHLSLRALVAGGNAHRTEGEAARWLHLAALYEHPDAFRLLGYRYQRGRGVPQSDEAAAYWFYQGALRGDHVSMVALGLRYAAGRGIPQDWTAAVYWWGQAQASTALASRFLGDAYTCGLGVAQDQERAAIAYQKAAESGEMSASIQLGHMYVNGCATANDRAAVEAYKRAADGGYPEAQVALSELVRQGRGVEPNPSEAYYWARLAEHRLPSGELRELARSRVEAAARLMTAETIAAAEQMVQTIIVEGAKPLR